MAKPSTLPRWANLADPGDIVDPPSGKKDSGWLVGEKPPHTYFNWWMELVYDWTVYLDGLTGEALTWTAAHIFSAAATFNQGIIVAKGGASYAVAASGQSYFEGGTNQYALTGLGNGSGSGGVFVAGATGPAAVLGTAGSTGANTQAGVRGVGVLAAPGVEGVGTATVGGYGVKGTSSATNTAGVLGISAGGGRGVEGVANAAGGIGVYGNSSAVDGVGGYFAAPGTSGLGAALSAYSASGRAVLSQGNLEVLAGDITMPVDKVIKYAASRTEWVRMPLSALKVQNAAAANNTDLFFEDSGATPEPPAWGSKVAAYDLVGGIIRVPAGATITRIEFLQSTTEVTGGVRYRIFKEVDTSTGRVLSWANPSGATFDIVSTVGGPVAELWYGQDVSISVPSNDFGAGDYGGSLTLHVRVDATLAAKSHLLKGIRFKYSYLNQGTAP